MKKVLMAFLLLLTCISLVYSASSSSRKSKQQQNSDATKKRNRKISFSNNAALKKRVSQLLSYSEQDLLLALRFKLYEKYYGASVIGADEEHTFLGKIGDSYDTDSIFNDYSRYGMDYSSDSIWNNVGRFGSDVSSYSPFNDVASEPPLILKNGTIIGRLTIRDSFPNAVNPYLLKALLAE